MYKNSQTLQVISEYLKATNVSTDITNDIDAEIERMIDTGEYSKCAEKHLSRNSAATLRSIYFAIDVILFYASNTDRLTSVALANMIGFPTLSTSIKTHLTSLRKNGVIDTFNTSRATALSKQGVYTYSPENLPDVIYVSFAKTENEEALYFVLNETSPLRQNGTTENTRIHLTHNQIISHGYIPVLSKSTGMIVKYVHQKYVVPEGFTLA
ncbi:MAG: hypothetical protein IPL23_22115 [Saprospiraceae bacterium]|nr:hypothetical protein [Saprospiraceae bacterium]